MTSAKLKMLVAEAIYTDRKKQEAEARLKEIKRMLIDEALSRPEEHNPAGEGDGTAWTWDSEDGCIARVNFPGPSLKSKIDGCGKAIDKIKDTAGRFFGDLFEQTPSWKPIEGFRMEAEKLLGKGAAKLMKLVTTESTPRVSFETKEIVKEA